MEYQKRADYNIRGIVNMRISGISSYNYNSRNNAVKNNKQVSFGRFDDENAEKELIKAADNFPKEVQRCQARQTINAIRDCCFNHVYTDKAHEGKIRVEWDDKMINAGATRNLDDYMHWFDDLREYTSMLMIKRDINRITENLLHIEPKITPSTYSEDKEERARQEERLSYLAF